MLFAPPTLPLALFYLFVHCLRSLLTYSPFKTCLSLFLEARNLRTASSIRKRLASAPKPVLARDRNKQREKHMPSLLFRMTLRNKQHFFLCSLLIKGFFLSRLQGENRKGSWDDTGRFLSFSFLSLSHLFPALITSSAGFQKI